MATTSVLAFWGVAALLIVVPGADWAFTLDAGLRRAVLPAVGGLVLGYLLLTAVVAAGVGVLVASSPRALTVLTLLGGAYLLVHGVTTLLRPGDAPAIGEVRAAPGSVWATLTRGIAVSGLNPKGLLLFLSLMPQFTSAGGSWPVAGQIGALGLVFVATCAGFYLTLGALAARSSTTHPGLARTIGRVSGCGMSVVGALLIVECLGGVTT